MGCRLFTYCPSCLGVALLISLQHTFVFQSHPHFGLQVIVFFTTARLTQYMAALIDAAGLPVLEIHSRKSQVRMVGRDNSQFVCCLPVVTHSNPLPQEPGAQLPMQAPACWRIPHALPAVITPWIT